MENMGNKEYGSNSNFDVQIRYTRWKSGDHGYGGQTREDGTLGAASTAAEEAGATATATTAVTASGFDSLRAVATSITS